MSSIDPMKIVQRWCFTLGLAAVVGLAITRAGPFDPPIVAWRIVAFPVDVNQDGQIDFQLAAAAVPLGGFPGTEITNNRVGFVVENLDSSRILRASSGRIQFRLGDEISLGSDLFTYPSGAQDLVIGGYDEYKVADSDWSYFDIYKNDPNNFWKNLTEMLIGVRTVHGDGYHFGWIKLGRPDTGFTTPFEVVDFSLHHIAGEPIAAGRPPVIRLKPEVTPQGLKVSWPGMSTMWILESSTSLGADAEWITIPDATSGEVLLPLPEANRFYRLRRL